MTAMRPFSFTDLEYEQKKKVTRKERFLGEMDAIIPWKTLLKPIRRHYPKVGNGRRPIGLEIMLRIYFMQQWYGLSDPAMEDSLYDITAMRRFAGVALSSIPDETSILHFRHLLERHGLTEVLFRQTERYLSDKGLILNEGTIVDATIIHAPTSTKNQERQRDPEMKQTKKGNQWYFGMKAHVGTDPQGFVHSIAVTDASIHDSQVMDDLIHGEEYAVYGDKAYASQQRQADYEAKGMAWRVSRKAGRGQKLTTAELAWNRHQSRTRAMGEHAFGVVKHLWGYTKVRYKGLEKNAAQVFTLFALANLYRARKPLMLVQG